MEQPFAPFIEIDGECYTEISNVAIPNIAPGQYINGKGIIYNSASKRFIHPSLNDGKYMYTHVYLNDGSKLQIGVHRLLMLVFFHIPGCENLQVNHKDLNKQNNSLSNLEWTTPKENIDHALRNGVLPYGESHGMSKLTEDQVNKICSKLSKGLYRGIFSELAKEFNVDINTIYDISKGRSWTRVSKNYDINYDEKLFLETPDEIIDSISRELSKNRYRGQLVELANKYGVNKSVVYDIAHGNTGKEISSQYNINYQWTPNLTENDVESICYKLKYDNHYGIIAELARDYEVSYSTISSIAHHRNWTYISDKYDLN